MSERTIRPKPQPPDPKPSIETIVKRALWLTRDMVKALVDHESAVTVTAKDNSRHVILTIQVHRGDTGLLLGHRGRNVDAMRSILMPFFRKHQLKYDLDVFLPDRDGDRPWKETR